MRSMRTFGMALAALGLLGGCSATGTSDGQLGQMGIPGPAGPVGPMGGQGVPGTNTNGFDELDLPGTAFYPESIASAADGTLYVGSFGSGRIVKFAPGSNTAVAFVTQLSAGKNVNGVLVDETDKSLLACVNDISPGALGVFKPLVKRFSLADGSEKASYQFLMAGACNDLGFDGKHNLYATDSFGKIYQLANGAQALTQWSADPLLAPPSATTFGADGIAWDGGTNMYVTNFARPISWRAFPWTPLAPRELR